MTRDVLITGIAEMNIRKENCSNQGLLGKPPNDIIACAEGKELARNALPQHPFTGAVSSFKKGVTARGSTPPDAKQKAN